ncbi:hypothetical protein LCGC14_0859270 [marine sediment metagenome]|uniref:Uncharacterized protein n=1 Tax=marine sediment metagenome TaxID=412755 RepID=A0A0F9PT62_9ZZZZ
MATMIQLVRQLAERLSPSEHVTGVADDHTATTLTDTRDQKYSSADANELDRKFIYLEAVKMQSRITEEGKAPATGILTVSPDVTDAPTAVTGSAANVSTTSTTLTDTDESMTVNEWAGYTIAAGGLYLDVTSNTATVLTGTDGWSDGSSGPGAVAWTVGTRYLIADGPIQTLKNAINLVLRNTFLPTFWPLSLHVMGNDANDMEPSTIATDYTAENSGTLATESTIVKNGAQALKATAGAALSGASTGNINVVEGKPYYAAADCSVKQGDDADFRVVNVQDSDAQIDDNATTDEPSWTELVIPFTPPSGCEQVDVFMLGTTSGDVTYWDDFQIWHGGAGVYPMPSWLTRPEQVIGVRAFPQGTGGPSPNDYRSNERGSFPLIWDFESVDRRGTSELRIWVDAAGARPFIYALRSLAELSADTDTTPADQDKVVNWASRYMEAETGEQRARVLSLLRSLYFVRPVTELPRRVGVTMA